MTKKSSQQQDQSPTTPTLSLTLAELAANRPDLVGGTCLRDLADMVDQAFPELVRATSRRGVLSKAEQDYVNARGVVISLIRDYKGDLQMLLERFDQVLDIVVATKKQVDAQNLMIEQQQGQLKAGRDRADQLKQDMAAVVTLTCVLTRLTRYEITRILPRGGSSYYAEFEITGRNGIHLGVDYSPTVHTATLTIVGASMSDYRFTVAVAPGGKLDSAAVLAVLGYLGHPKVDPKVLELDRETTFPKAVHGTLHPSVASQAEELANRRSATARNIGGTALKASSATYSAPSPSLARIKEISERFSQPGLDGGGQHVIGITVTPPLEHGSDPFGRENTGE